MVYFSLFLITDLKRKIWFISYISFLLIAIGFFLNGHPFWHTGCTSFSRTAVQIDIRGYDHGSFKEVDHQIFLRQADRHQSSQVRNRLARCPRWQNGHRVASGKERESRKVVRESCEVVRESREIVRKSREVDRDLGQDRQHVIATAVHVTAC